MKYYHPGVGVYVFSAWVDDNGSNADHEHENCARRCRHWWYFDVNLSKSSRRLFGVWIRRYRIKIVGLSRRSKG